MIERTVRYRAERSGYTIFVLFIAITGVSILALSIFTLVRDITASTARHAESIKATYLAEAGIHKALWDINNILAQTLVTPKRPFAGHVQKVNEELLALLDIERARRWTRQYQFTDDALAKGGKAFIRMELLDVVSTPFSTFLDPLDKVPPYLECYHLKRYIERERQLGLTPLGGWRGKLKITVTARYRKSRRTIESWRSIHVVDITPPAADYTLFIEGTQREYLKEGRFVLSNLTIPGPVKEQINRLGKAVNEVLRLDIEENHDPASLRAVRQLNASINRMFEKDSAEDALKTIFEISTHASDRKVKDTLDRMILSLDPRDWGRVRTNGALFVHLPFFATDDIINYITDPSPMRRRRPEVGFIGCENRLHDTYLSIYTLFEGRIYKVFHRLQPMNLGPGTEPREVPPQRYTINTKMNYPRMRPRTRLPSLLERLKQSGRLNAQWYSKEPRWLLGTRNNPVRLNGIMYFDKPLVIAGYYSGRGLVACASHIKVRGSLLPVNKSDKLCLVSIGGAIRLDGRVRHMKICAALYAKQGLKGTSNQHVTVTGNLVVDTLRRNEMPRYFTCNYNAGLKNHLADNIVGVISRLPVLQR